MAKDFLKIYKGLSIKPRSSDPIDPINGDIQWSDGTVRPSGLWNYKDGSWSSTGGAGGGGLDTFYTQDFETYGVGDFTSGLNPVYKTAGTFGGALSTESASPIASDSSPKYTAGVTSTNDWFDVEVIDLDLKQRNLDIGIVLWADMANFSVDAEFVMWDVTNGNKLDTSGLDIIKANESLSRYSFSVFIPANTAQISWGFHMVNAPVNGESFIFDDIELSTNPFIYKDLTDQHVITYTNFTSRTSNIVKFTTLDKDTNGGLLTSNNATTTKITAVRSCYIDASITGKGGTSGDYVIEVRNPGGTLLYSSSGRTTTASTSVSLTYQLEIGDYVQVFSSQNLTTTVAATNFSVKATATTEHVITPLKSKPNTFAARIANNGTASITSESSSFIQSVSRTAAGIVEITFTPGFFTIPPVVAITREGASTTAGMETNIPTTTGLTSFSIHAGAYVDENFSITVTRQGTDYQENFGLSATPTPKICYIKDVKASGNHGGDFTSGAWQTRDLNTLSGDFSFASIATNQITLQPGKYEIEASAPAFEVNNHKCKFYNITDSTDDIIGTSERIAAGSVSTTLSRIVDEIVITSAKTFELQHRCTSTKAANGFGTLSGFGVDEVYSQVKITKLR